MFAAKVLVFAIAFVAFVSADDGINVVVVPTNNSGKIMTKEASSGPGCGLFASRCRSLCSTVNFSSSYSCKVSFWRWVEYCPCNDYGTGNPIPPTPPPFQFSTPYTGPPTLPNEEDSEDNNLN